MVYTNLAGSPEGKKGSEPNDRTFTIESETPSQVNMESLNHKPYKIDRENSLLVYIKRQLELHIDIKSSLK